MDLREERPNDTEMETGSGPPSQPPPSSLLWQTMAPCRWCLNGPEEPPGALAPPEGNPGVIEAQGGGDCTQPGPLQSRSQ